MSAQFDEVMELFRQTSREIAEADRRFKETLEAQSKEAEARAEARASEFTAQLRESARLADERAKEAAERAKEAAERTKALEASISRVSANIGRLGNRLGEWVEAMVRPATVRLFQDRGIDVHEVFNGVQATRGGVSLEIDLLVVDDIEAVAVECKSQLTPTDVEDHVERMGKIKAAMPRYASMNIYGAVAGMSVTPEVQRFAERQGFFVIVPNGDTVMIANPKEFAPKAW